MNSNWFGIATPRKGEGRKLEKAYSLCKIKGVIEKLVLLLWRQKRLITELQNYTYRCRKNIRYRQFSDLQLNVALIPQCILEFYNCFKARHFFKTNSTCMPI